MKVLSFQDVNATKATIYTNEIFTTQNRINAARVKGFSIVRGDIYTLLVDLDSPDLALQPLVLDILDRKYSIEQIIKWKSEGGNQHYLIKIKNAMSILARIAIQVALGSDPVREALAVELYLKGCPEEDVSVLFRPRDAIVTQVPHP